MRPSWTAEDVLRAVRGQSLHVQDWTAQGVSIDSRSLQTGDLFVAIKGPTLDGHDYVRHAFEQGAAAAIVEHQPAQVPPDAPLIFVDDTFTALQDLGRVGRLRCHGHILAVTGSVGKTSSKEMLRLMLGALDDTYATEGSLNNHWGVPLSLARLPAGVKYGVFELGMNHAGEMGPLAREVKPHVALITNIEAVHLAHFASVEAIADAKAEIFLGMDANGVAVLNRDNPHFARLLAAARTQGLKKTLGFGHDPKSDARIVSLHADEAGTDVEALLLGKKISYRVGTPGEHLALNALGALLACAAVGADTSLCAEALAAYRPPMGRGTRQKINLGSDISLTVLDESYNASPAAVRAAIAVLGKTPVSSGGRRIAVLGDMRELGDTGPALHKALAEALIDNKVDIVHCCGELMAHLYGALPPSLKGHLAMTSEELAPLVVAGLHEGDAVMVKGSHSMHMEKVIRAIQTLGTNTAQKLAG